MPKIFRLPEDTTDDEEQKPLDYIVEDQLLEDCKSERFVAEIQAG